MAETDASNRELSMLVEEWKEIQETERQLQSVILQVAAILIPISFGMFGLAVNYKLRSPSLAMGSVAVYFLWLVFMERYNFLLYSGRDRAIEIEKANGVKMRLHTEIRLSDEKGIRRIWRIRYFAWIFLFALVVVWVFYLVFGV